MIEINLDKLRRLTPSALPVNRAAINRVNVMLPRFKILDNMVRAEHFLAQVLHETVGLARNTESLNYTAERLMAVWKHRFPTYEIARRYAHNPKLLANYVYGGRLGNEQPDDGWKFIGRGLLQITGRANYREIGERLGLPLVDEPALVLTPEHALAVAGEVWVRAGCNALADKDDIVGVTRAINGGTVGLADRRRWLDHVRKDQVVEDIVV